METKNRFWLNKLAAACLLLGAACQPALVPVPRPTPAVLTVQSTPALQPLGQAYSACAEELENTGLVLLETPAASIDLKKAALALRWGMDAPGAGGLAADHASVIGEEELVIIVHPQNPLNSIALPGLRAIYSGAQRDWTHSTPPVEIQPWVYLDGDDSQGVFEAAVLKDQKASARVVSLAPDPAAMREVVAASPAAIGFLPRRWLDGTVKAIPVDGLDSSGLRRPILAISSAAPAGAAKNWLLCLQEKVSE